MVSLAVGRDPLVPPVANSFCDLTLRGTRPYVAPKPLYPLAASSGSILKSNHTLTCIPSHAPLAGTLFPLTLVCPGAGTPDKQSQ